MANTDTRDYWAKPVLGFGIPLAVVFLPTIFQLARAFRTSVRLQSDLEALYAESSAPEHEALARLARRARLPIPWGLGISFSSSLELLRPGTDNDHVLDTSAIQRTLLVVAPLFVSFSLASLSSCEGRPGSGVGHATTLHLAPTLPRRLAATC